MLKIAVQVHQWEGSLETGLMRAEGGGDVTPLSVKGQAGSSSLRGAARVEHGGRRAQRCPRRYE